MTTILAQPQLDPSTWPTWAKVIFGSIIAIAGLLTAIRFLLLPPIIGLVKDVRAGLQETRDKAVAAETLSQVNSQRITNVSAAHSALEQTVTNVAANALPASALPEMVKAVADTMAASVRDDLPPRVQT